MSTHTCGGTVLVGGADDQRHQYCDRCHAYTYDMDADTLPTGIDREINRSAWDGGDVASPPMSMRAGVKFDEDGF